jgi:hypothetical protein
MKPTCHTSKFIKVLILLTFGVFSLLSFPTITSKPVSAGLRPEQAFLKPSPRLSVMPGETAPENSLIGNPRSLSLSVPSSARASKADAGIQARVNESYGRVPLIFEANQGQTDEQVKFISRGRGYTLFLTASESVLVLRKAQRYQSKQRWDSLKERKLEKLEKGYQQDVQPVVRIKVEGTNATARVVGMEEMPGKSNYFIGSDPTKWRTNVPHYAKVKYEELYPGIDLVYYGNQQQLEYDFIIKAGADPSVIAFKLEGAEKMWMEESGDLVIETPTGSVRQRRPLIYQEIDGVKIEVSGGYIIREKSRIGFEVAKYDRERPLVIDPVLNYSTYLGGSGNDQGLAIAVDPSGGAYVTGETLSSNFPTMNALQPTKGSVSRDAFVTKLSNDGTALVYSTYLGGNGTDIGHGIAVDGFGNAYVTGETNSTNFPLANPVQNFCACSSSTHDVFVTKLNSAGNALVYSTYLGGSADDVGLAIAVDSAGSAYVTGNTSSSSAGGFPTSAGAFERCLSGACPGLVRAAFVTKFHTTGFIIYSTYLGLRAVATQGHGIAVDASGNAYVTGYTNSSNFPTRNPLQPTNAGSRDAFVTKLNNSGSDLVYSTYLGGFSDEEGNAIGVDSSGNALYYRLY